VYNAIADEIRSVNGVRVIGVSADSDHNRTVITFVGEPEVVEEAAFRAIRLAARVIDLNNHTGEHPRIGATDVCPFIPVRGVSMSDCVEMAQRVGKRVGEELNIAVYLYGEAATRPDRTLLSTIRKGEFEQWVREIGSNPERNPDFGPAEPATWGATVIGARPFLIAYNLYLNTADVAVAKEIASAVRHSSGGLRFVQAMGFLVEGQAQVSMNLTNFEKTPIHRVQEMVKREAAQHGLQVTRAELIGLAPQQALMDSARWYLQLGELDDDQILEYRLAREDAEDTEWLSFEPFLEALSSSAPTPGGGSAAALVGAMGASLTEMMARLTVGRKKYAGVELEAQAVQGQATELRQSLSLAVREDARAFETVMTAYRNREASESDRAAQIENATVAAGEVPLEVARKGLQVARLALKIVSTGNERAVTDGATAALMARTAVQAARLNVLVNGVGLQDKALAQRWREELERLESEVSAIADEAMQIAAERGGFA
jgi:glutamate formiminotransferase/formiminotetrahydrofolate cyclodeaminase